TLGPENIGACHLCADTGRRPLPGEPVPPGAKPYPDTIRPEEIARFDGCNGCLGLEQRLKWPTFWKPHPGHIRPVHTITTGYVPSTVLTADGEWHQPSEVGAIGAEFTTAVDDPAWKTYAQPL